jgi:hypothetical protein
MTGIFWHSSTSNYRAASPYSLPHTAGHVLRGCDNKAAVVLQVFLGLIAICTKSTSLSLYTFNIRTYAAYFKKCCI